MSGGFYDYWYPPGHENQPSETRLRHEVQYHPTSEDDNEIEMSVFEESVEESVDSSRFVSYQSGTIISFQ